MKKKHRILIVDDEPNIRKILQAAFERAGYSVDTSSSGDEAVQKLSSQQCDMTISDVLMPGMSGVELLKKAKKLHPDMPFIVMTAYGTIPQAVEAMREGAADYITKPFDLDSVKKSVAFWLPKIRKAPLHEKTSSAAVIAESRAMREAMEMVQRVADAKATVLITGESGTGKEVIAKALHRLSSRASEPFVAVNCAAIPETLLESELFGVEKGAFTGADVARPGRFELAHGGTLFLDEIGEIAPSTQVKLLRVLQEKEVERLGAAKPKAVDVRLVAATNRNLQEAVETGQFREDLFFRLQVLQIELLPLRERVEDILPMAEQFLSRFAAANGSSIQGLDDEVKRLLQGYRWPGNVRELENIIERAIVLSSRTSTILTREALPPQLLRAA